MAIVGTHMLIHTPEAEAVRTLFDEVFGWTNVDMGQGWLIFALPPAEIAVHPSDRPHHEISFMCNDLDATVAALGAKGVEFKGEPTDEGWGIAVTMVLPGPVEMVLYEPRHPTAI